LEQFDAKPFRPGQISVERGCCCPSTTAGPSKPRTPKRPKLRPSHRNHVPRTQHHRSPDGPAVLGAVRASIAREVERVEDPVAGVPGGDPSDVAGWHPTTASLRERSNIGQPYYDPETWRWFQLVDVAYLDELVIIEFRWADPTTPHLRYIFICHVDQVSSVETAASVVRAQLRVQLAPGWRDRLGHRWVGNDRVLLWRQGQQRQRARDAASWAL